MAGGFSSSGSNYEVCGQFNGIVGPSAPATVTCSQLQQGRYVAVQIPGTNEQLTICELFVLTEQGDITVPGTTVFCHGIAHTCIIAHLQTLENPPTQTFKNSN